MKLAQKLCERVYFTECESPQMSYKMGLLYLQDPRERERLKRMR